MKKITPNHIAIIMDGNRRWAESKGLSLKEGHRRGVFSLKRIVKYCGKIGVKYLTVYAFSTENKLRSGLEVRALFQLFEEALEKEVPELNDYNVSIKFIGNLLELPSSLIKKAREGEELLKSNTGLRLMVALNYGGRAEIIQAIKKVKKVSEAEITNNLYTNGVPDPDLLIRPGGEFRLSNFLLWQVAYSELYFTKKLWPDFKENDLDKAIQEFVNRKRRFGK